MGKYCLGCYAKIIDCYIPSACKCLIKFLKANDDSFFDQYRDKVSQHLGKNCQMPSYFEGFCHSCFEKLCDQSYTQVRQVLYDIDGKEIKKTFYESKPPMNCPFCETPYSSDEFIDEEEIEDFDEDDSDDDEDNDEDEEEN